MDYLIFVLIGFASSLVSAVFGLGTALLMLSLGALILPIKETIALATVMFLAAGIAKTLLFHRKIDWQTTAWVTIGSIPFAYVGGTLVDTVPSETLKKMLGAMILLYLLIGLKGGGIAYKPGKSGLVAGSCLYGFLSGLLGSGNIIKAILFREMSLNKESFVGIMAATSILTNASKLTAYINDGLISVAHTNTMIGLVASAIVSAVIGRSLLRKITVNYFQQGVSIVLACVAVSLFF